MVGDFGLTTDGTSKAALSTALGRGTSGYRAPEIVKEFSTYNNKVDIFALACILYELLSEGKKLFSSDFQVLQWALTVPVKLIAPDLSAVESGHDHSVKSVLRWMGSIDPSERPTAFELQRMFYKERALAVAYTCSQRGDYDLAFGAYKTAVERETPEFPISFTSLYSLAQCCYQLQKHMEAVHFYGLALPGLCISMEWPLPGLRRNPTAYRCSISVTVSSGLGIMEEHYKHTTLRPRNI